MLVWLKRIEEYSSFILFVSGVVVILYGVFTRYVLNMPQSWIQEIFTFLLVWSIFIGFGMALRNGQHIVVDIMYDRLPYSFKYVLSIISNFIGAIYSFFMMGSGIKIVMITYTQQNVTLDVGIPMWIPYLIMPIGMGLVGMYFLLKMYRAFKKDKNEIYGVVEHEEYVKEVLNDGRVVK